jgi:hypothetical protein
MAAEEADMPNYANASSRSGVLAYEIGEDWIEVMFMSGENYRYTYEATGAEDVEAMKRLAESGKGLSTFIARNVGDRYESKGN